MAGHDGIDKRSGMKSSALVSIVALVVIVAVVTSFVLYSAARVEWKVDRVDGTYDEVQWPYIATDDTGTLHMTYYVNGSLIHSALTDDGWEHSNIVEASIWGASPIVFDSAGTPHICYQVEDETSTSSPNNYILMHAEKADGEWISSVVSSMALKGSHSMALDASGNAYVAFIRSGYLFCANDTSGDWQETLLLGLTYASNYGMTSIAIDASGHPYVAVGSNSGFVGVCSDVGGSWNLTTLFNWDLTYNSVSIDISDDGTVLVCYWGYPVGEPDKRGVMLATRGPGGWAVEPVYTPESDTNEFRCSISATEGGSVKIAVERCDDRDCWLAVITSCEGGWAYSDVIGPYDNLPYSMYQSQLSICSSEDGHTIVPVTRGFAEYATDSLNFSDRLSSVSLVALAGYSIGLVIWVVVLRVVRVFSDRAERSARDR